MELSKGMILRSNFDKLTIKVIHIVDGYITFEVLRSDFMAPYAGETFERRLDKVASQLRHFTIIGGNNE